jgi:hypothetical protein
MPTTFSTRLPVPVIAISLVMAACSSDAPDREASPGAVASLPVEQVAFWRSLRSLCGNAYLGRTVASEPPDAMMAQERLVMHVRQCSADTIRIPFHVGEDRSRTWVLTRTAMGLRLKHDHRHEDGSPDSVTMYGGDTRDAGDSTRQAFHADSLTARLIPVAATNVWTVELAPGRTFAYALRREGSSRYFRAEFDLSAPIAAPPPPWGSR